MSTIRLPFLYPVLFKSARSSPRAFFDLPLPTSISPQPRAAFSTSRRRCRPTEFQRYGTANQPPPPLTGERKQSTTNPDTAKAEPTLGATDHATQPKPQREKKLDDNKGARDGKEAVSPDSTSQYADQRQQQHGTSETVFPEEQASNHPQIDLPATPAKSTPSPESTWQAQQWTAATQPSPNPGSGPTNALSTILNMEPPMSEGAEEEKPPHLQAPQYVHHFDTYTLVNTLRKAGWGDDQAVTLMKAVRASLADNMELAREGLVSKADAEMESYLFRAACSELRTELRSTRQTTADRTRTDRTSLQHENDILGQRISADTANLKDELRGMMDDRKMAVRQDRRSMENRIQELNYRITLKLQSEVRSDIEGLRFVMTRRTIFALAVVIVTSLLMLRLVSSAGGMEDAVATGKAKVAGRTGSEFEEEKS